jgi:flavin reductase (DIM6/NTAB) family NADH-FMN oxidoreductase RutF
MRLLTNPVVVCTARDTWPISNNGKERSAPRAMTMSSFTSLSLSPTPLVTFNVATPSRTLEAIKNSGEFNVHILAGDGSGALVAENFTRGNTDDVFDRLVGAKCKNTTTAADGEGSSSSTPILEGDGVLYVLRCRVAADQAPEGGLIHVRDHVIVIGEVLEVIPGSRIEDGFGLAYADRSYRAAGAVIAKH